MPTEDLGESMVTHSCCIQYSFIPIYKKNIVLVMLQFSKCILLVSFQKASFLFHSKKLLSCFVPKSFFLVSFQKASFLFRSKKLLSCFVPKSFLFRSKIDCSFLASLWFDYIQQITLRTVVLLIKQYFIINITNNFQCV